MLVALLDNLDFVGASLWQRPAFQNAVDVRFQLNLDVVLIDLDFLNDELKVVPIQLGLLEDVIKDLHGGLGRPVHPDDGVAPVRRHGDLVLQTLHPAQEVALQLVVGLL